MKPYSGRLGLVQRVLPSYRAPFFDLLAQHCDGGLQLFAGQPRPNENITTTRTLKVAQFTQALNLHLFDGSFYLCYQRGLLSWLGRSDPDALILEANPRYLSSPAAIDWMRARQRPVIGWGLGAPPIRGPLAGLRGARRRAFLTQFDVLIAYSSPGAQQYRELGIAEDRIFVAPNAVAPAPKGAPPKRPDHFKEQPNVLFVGRLQARKGLDRLIRACAAQEEARAPRLRIVGEGPERANLERLASQLYPATEFLGARFGPELDELFAQADLFVLPGTGGLAIQQAMAHALPIIAAEGDGTQADLVTQENGWLLPPNEQAAISRTLTVAISDAARLRRMGIHSFQQVQQRYNLQAMLEIFLETLSRVTA